MTRILLFPYHPDIITLIEFKSSLVEFELCGVASYIDDAEIVRKLNNEIRCSDANYNNLLEECDAILLLDNYRNYALDKYYEIISDAINFRKKIYITPLAATQLDLGNYAGKYELLARYPTDLSEIDKEYDISKQINAGMRMYKIEPPILAILGQGKCCSKFETQLLVSNYLSKDYEYSWVSSNALGVLFGGFTLPPFLFSEKISFQEKIVKYNHYIYKLTENHPSDCILLGIPEGILPFRRKEFNHFAEQPLIASYAVDIDVSILCTYFTGTDLSEESLRNLINYCHNRFSVTVSAAVVSKTSYHLPEQNQDPITYVFFDQQFLKKYYPHFDGINFPFIDLMHSEKSIRTFKRAIHQIEENMDVI